jgi:hypothetical protein
MFSGSLGRDELYIGEIDELGLKRIELRLPIGHSSGAYLRNDISRRPDGSTPRWQDDRGRSHR